MDLNISEHNAKFENGFGVILGTQKWREKGLAGMVCKLIEKDNIADFQFDSYIAEVNFADCNTIRIIISTAEMNPVSMEYLAKKANTHKFWWMVEANKSREDSHFVIPECSKRED